jgi:hypothetical protein
MAARKQIENESTEPVSEATENVDFVKSNMDVVFLNDEIEITYSRSWELAIVKYEQEALFHSMKVRVSMDADLAKVGEALCDKMTELQESDLIWARTMSTNPGSLITRILPEIPE